jgi:hypothetical protein
LALANAFDEFGREFGSDYGDAGSGFEQAGDFRGSDSAATDDENVAIV